MRPYWRATLGAGGVFMMVDGLISLDVPNDKRPALQAGRVLRTLVGLGLFLVAAAARPEGA